MEFLKNSHLDNITSLVVEVYIKGTMVVSNMLLQHLWEAPYKPERPRMYGSLRVPL